MNLQYSHIWRVSFLALATTVFSGVTAAQVAATEFASIAVNEVSRLREGITLAIWIDTRGKRENWKSKRPEVDPLHPHPECLVQEKTQALSTGARVTEALYFYPPQPHAPFVFPTGSAKQLLSDCVLGMIRIEAEAPSPEFGHMLDQAVRERLTGAGRWAPHAEIVSAYDAQPGQPAVFVRARLPLARTGFEVSTDTSYRYRSLERTQFHRAVAMVGADVGLSGRFTKLYDLFPAAPRPEDLLAVLREWVSALRAAPSGRRAAGLYAADIFLETAGKTISGWPAKRKPSSELQRLGAIFQFEELGNAYFFTRNWAKEARQLDPNGPAGQMAIIGFMARESCSIAGWDSKFFRDVVRDGEGLLAKGLDAQTAAQVHFMAGDAYSDMVAIAGGLSGPNGDYSSQEFAGEARMNRGKAIQHYRAGLAVDNTSETAKDAWKQAWRLLASLLPDQRYVCFGD